MVSLNFLVVATKLFPFGQAHWHKHLTGTRLENNTSSPANSAPPGGGISEWKIKACLGCSSKGDHRTRPIWDQMPARSRKRQDSLSSGPRGWSRRNFDPRLKNRKSAAIPRSFGSTLRFVGWSYFFSGWDCCCCCCFWSFSTSSALMVSILAPFFISSRDGTLMISLVNGAAGATEAAGGGGG